MEKLFIKSQKKIKAQTCYACINNLVGEIKYNTNHTEEWECRCTEEEIYDVRRFFCPMCDVYYEDSSYLNSVIPNEKTLWIANMITHYRHKHVKWWDNRWGRNGYGGRKYGDYDKEKPVANNTFKRQIIKKCKDFLELQGIGKEHFLELQENDEMTLQLINKKLQ